MAHEFGHILDNRLADEPTKHIRNIRPMPNDSSISEARYLLKAHRGLGVWLWSGQTYFELWADAFASWSLDRFSQDLWLGGSEEASLWKRDISTYLSELVTERAIRWQKLIRLER